MSQASFPLTPLTNNSGSEVITQRLYTTPQVARLTGLTRRQVFYWTQIQLITATFHDSSADVGKPSSFYTAAEVIKALIAADLRHSGFSLRQVQQVISNLQEHGIDLSDAKSYLLTDGYTVYYAFSDLEVVDILKHHRQMLLLVPIHEQIAKLVKVA